jgi:DNA-binding IclR family transcriptional regulator
MAGKTSRTKRRKTSVGGRTVQSVDRAVAIVDRLSRSPAGLTLTELARALELPPQTAQSLVRTLQRRGWVAQEGRGAPYRLGPALGEIVRRRASGQDRAALAGPVVSELCRQAREYVVVAEWSGDGLAPVVESHPDRELTVRGDSFAPARLHTMATGKVLLAHRDPDALHALLERLPLERRGPRSVTDPGRLRKRLASIRRAGVAVCREEAAEGIVALAVPIVEPDDTVRAALGISLPLSRYSAARRKELTGALKAAARKVAEAWA